jgi:WD40 repeat protein
LALATYDDRIELRQMSDGRLLRKINQRTFHITKLAFAPNGATLAGLREERAVQLWQVSNGRLLRTFKRDRDITWYSATTDIAFSPDGTLLASATGFEIRLWNAATGKEYATIRGANSITSLAFAPNGRTIVAGVAHGGMREWSVRDGHRVVTLDFDVGASVDSVAFVPNSDTLALGLRDMSVRLWRTENPKMQQSTRVLRTDDPTTPLSKPSRPIPVWSDQDDPGIISLAFAPDGSTLAGAWDGGVRVWRLDGTSLGWLNGYQR